jgi:hypothetical protein
MVFRCNQTRRYLTQQIDHFLGLSKLLDGFEDKTAYA